jgi:hypothetical protein
MDGIIFLIYIISLISAFVALWVWYSGDQGRDEIAMLKLKNQELERRLDEISTARRLEAGASAFKRR